MMIKYLLYPQQIQCYMLSTELAHGISYNPTSINKIRNAIPCVGLLVRVKCGPFMLCASGAGCADGVYN